MSEQNSRGEQSRGFTPFGGRGMPPHGSSFIFDAGRVEGVGEDPYLAKAHRGEYDNPNWKSVRREY